MLKNSWLSMLESRLCSSLRSAKRSQSGRMRWQGCRRSAAVESLEDRTLLSASFDPVSVTESALGQSIRRWRISTPMATLISPSRILLLTTSVYFWAMETVPFRPPSTTPLQILGPSRLGISTTMARLISQFPRRMVPGPRSSVSCWGTATGHSRTPSPTARARGQQ